MCIQTNNIITNGRPIGFENDEFYLKTDFEMERLFSQYPDALKNTAKIADLCNFEFDFSHIYLPKFEAPAQQRPAEYLRRLAYDGLQCRIDAGNIVFDAENTRAVYENRIEYELSVINKMGYDEYYLIVWDYVNYAKSNGIATGPGRGSGAGSLVAYLVGITEVDSIWFNLMFERFLNPERISMPDFDVDFCDEHRHKVIEYVTQKYGQDRVSQIITFGTLAAKAAVRDVGRALGMPYSEVDTIAKLIPNELKITLKKALESDAELKRLYDSDERTKKLIDIAVSVEGMPRNISTHAAGVVITELPVYSYVPLAVSGDFILTQYDMDTIAKLGLVKFDFLGIRYLTTISDTEKQIREREPEFDSNKIPPDDAKTFEMLSRGRGEGVFQLESAGMRKLLMQMKPSCLEDIIAAIALYRPGPMDSIPKFLENRADPSKIQYISPKLEKILNVTYGVTVYQEQVMEIFREIAGYSYGKADIVRRMMSKKKSLEMQEQREIFLYGERDKSGHEISCGAIANGLSEQEANTLFDELAGFAKYAFNKSHAASYAFLCYQTAYLKCNYFAEYMSSLLTSVLGNLPKTSEYIVQCQKAGIRVLPPDINESDKYFHVVYRDGKPCIRFGLLAVKNIGAGFADGILAEQKKEAFRSFEDFIARMAHFDINKKQVEFLIKCGAFDSFGKRRSQLLSCYEILLDHEIERAKRSMSGQIDLFSIDDSDELRAQYEYPDIPEFSARELLQQEKEAMGQYFSGHVLDEYKKSIASFHSTGINDILLSFEEDSSLENRVEEHQRVTVCGIISAKTMKNTKNGDMMAFITVEDRYAEIEIIVFPKILAKYGSLIYTDSPVAVSGEVTKREEEAPKLLAAQVASLIPDASFDSGSGSPPSPSYAPKACKTLYVKVPDADISNPFYRQIISLIEIYISEQADGKAVIFSEKEKKYYKMNGRIDITDGLISELSRRLGKDHVVIR